jgi:hypothetical protein
MVFAKVSVAALMSVSVLQGFASDDAPADLETESAKCIAKESSEVVPKLEAEVPEEEQNGDFDLALGRKIFSSRVCEDDSRNSSWAPVCFT